MDRLKRQILMNRTGLLFILFFIKLKTSEAYINAFYCNRKQFDTVQGLKHAIEFEWEEISEIRIQNLVKSMAKHCVEAIKSNRNK